MYIPLYFNLSNYQICDHLRLSCFLIINYNGQEIQNTASQILPMTVSKTNLIMKFMSILHAYFTILRAYKNATRDVGKLASSAKKDGAFGSHILIPPWHALSVDILEFLQIT